MSAAGSQGTGRPEGAGHGKVPSRQGRPEGRREAAATSRGQGQQRRAGGQGQRSGAGQGRRPEGARGAGRRVAERQGAGRANRATPARKAAVEALRKLRERSAFAQSVIDSTVDTASLSPEDKAFATRLVLGVVSTRGVLSELVDRCLRSPSDVEDDVRDALLLSAYEMVYLRKAPHAAVDQGVELVRSVAPRAGGLANAVLRKVAAARERFPFGDPSRDLAAYARLHGFPHWLAERLVADLGPTAAHGLMVASNEPAPVFVAVNALRMADDEACAVLRAAKGDPQRVEVRGVVVPGCYRLSSGTVLLDGRVRRLLRSGALLVSDAAAQAVAARVVAASAPEGSFLEVGAGRGTKTILLQSGFARRCGAQAERFVAVDSHGFKTELLRERAEAYGVSVAEAFTGDATDLGALVGDRRFDAVFVDAPCSGLGTLRRHVDIRWRLAEPLIAEHAALGARLLRSAAAQVAPGGLLAYATCTVTPEENAGVVEGFLASADGQGFSPIEQDGERFFATQLVPGGCDAHFLALLRRQG